LHGSGRGPGGRAVADTLDDGVRSSISKTVQNRQYAPTSNSRRPPAAAIATTALHMKGFAQLPRGGGGGGHAGLREMQVHSQQQPQKLQQIAAFPPGPAVLSSKRAFVEQRQQQQLQQQQQNQQQQQQQSSKWGAFVDNPRVFSTTNCDDDDGGFATSFD